jgi:hypothetical protein
VKNGVTERSETIPESVSAVICAWNNWPDLEMTIESALRQSYQPHEVIVVDNSSSDATPDEVPRRFGHRVRYIRQLNRECAGAYNAGFAVASGQFIQFVDGDDVLAPGKIEKQMEVFRANPELDVVYGDVRMFQTPDGAANWIDPSTDEEHDILRALLSPDVGLCALGTLWRRRALERVGPWDEALYVEDLDYFLRAAWAGCRFGHCPGGPMGFSRVRSGQKTANGPAMAKGMEAVWRKALGYVDREPYRSVIAARLAECRFSAALSRDHLTKREALAQLTLARATSPDTISALRYAVAWLAVVFPGGVYFAGLRGLQPTRHVLGRLLRYGESGTSVI